MCSTKVCELINQNYHKQNIFNKECIIYNYFLEIFKLSISCPL